jgi:hypothetical protein
MSSIESNKKNPEQVKVCPTLIKWAGFAIQQHRHPLKLEMLLEVLAEMKELEEVGMALPVLSSKTVRGS